MNEMNRFIAEKVMGLQWFESKPYNEKCSCGECHWYGDPADANPDYTTALDYFALLQLAIGSKWWKSFEIWAREEYCDYTEDRPLPFIPWFLAPENLSRLIVEYHGYKNNPKTA